MLLRLIDLTWHRYWMLIVLKRVGNVWKRTAWLCQCDCWNTCVSTWNILRVWHKVSCWCKKRLHPPTKTHWLSRHRMYSTWISMVSRCSKEKWYCDRWITVCDRRLWDSWIHNFIEDMYPSFKEWLTLDRIDPLWNYCKENCRRADSITQGNNKYNSMRIAGISPREIADKQWINIHTIHTRVRRWWTEDEILLWKRDVARSWAVKYFSLYTIPELSKITWKKRWTIKSQIVRWRSIEKILSNK